MTDPVSSELLAFLESLWKTRSLTRAAELRGLSLSTATRLIAEARHVFGDPLFIRGGSGMVPTPKMTGLIRRITELLDGMRTLAVTEPLDPARFTGTVRLAGVDNSIFAFILPGMNTIYRQAPHIRLSFCSLGDRFLESLETGDTDMAFYAPPGLRTGPGFHTAELFSSGHVLVTRAGHPLQKRWEEKGRLTAADLAPWRRLAIGYGHDVGRPRSAESQIGEENADIAFDMPYFLPAPFILAETDFIVRLPVFTARIFSKHFPLFIIPASEKHLPVWHPVMVWHERTHADPTAQWLRSLLITGIRERFRSVTEEFSPL